MVVSRCETNAYLREPIMVRSTSSGFLNTLFQSFGFLLSILPVLKLSFYI